MSFLALTRQSSTTSAQSQLLGVHNLLSSRLQNLGLNGGCGAGTSADNTNNIPSLPASWLSSLLATANFRPILSSTLLLKPLIFNADPVTVTMSLISI